MDIRTNDLTGGDSIYCPACCNRNVATDDECAICGYVNECQDCANVIAFGDVCDCTNAHAEDLHERERYDDDGREYADPRDFREGLE